jgi:hypothetical protein
MEYVLVGFLGALGFRVKRIGLEASWGGRVPSHCAFYARRGKSWPNPVGPTRRRFLFAF